MPIVINEPDPKKWKDLSRPEKTIGLIIIAVVAIIPIAVIWSVLGSGEQETVQQASKQQSPEPTVETGPEINLAELVEQEPKTQLNVDSFTEGLSDPDRDQTSALWYISDFENVNSSTVRINLQTSLDEEEAKRSGVIAFGLIGGQIEQVETVVIRDSSGIDKANIFRNDVPVLNIGN